MRSKTHKVVVKFNQQQLQLLENLKKEAEFGAKYEDIILNIFREYAKCIPEMSPTSASGKTAKWIGGVLVKEKRAKKNQ